MISQIILCKKVLLRQRKKHTGLDRVPPRKDMGPVEVLWDGDIMGWIWGTTCEWTDTCENITFPHYSDVGGNNAKQDNE